MKRKAGILLHITSLPGKDGIGTLDDALEFPDTLPKAGQTMWQILPINPTEYNPFVSSSLLAGNPLLIGLEALVGKGDLEKKHHNH